MRSVIDDLKRVLLCDLSDPLGAAHIAVNVYRQDRGGLLRNQRLDLLLVDRIIVGLYVAKHRRQPVAHDGVGRGGKGKRGRNDLASRGKLHGRDHVLQRKMAVGIKHYMRAVQIRLQLPLELLMLFPHVGQPVAVPHRPDLFAVFLKGGHGGTGDIDRLRHGLKSFQMSVLIFAAR